MRREVLRPFAPVGLVIVLAGLIAWVWMGDWRYALTGLLLGSMVAVFESKR